MIAFGLRTRLRLPLEDCLEVMHRSLRPDISRSALHHCFKRQGSLAHTIASRQPLPEGYVYRTARVPSMITSQLAMRTVFIS